VEWIESNARSSNERALCGPGLDPSPRCGPGPQLSRAEAPGCIAPKCRRPGTVQGVHWINHLGHGHPTDGLRLSCRSYPTVQPCGPLASRDPVSDLQELSNTDYFFIYSDGCDAGSFDGRDCMAEAFTTGSAHGAFAVIMNARAGLGVLGPDGVSLRFHRLFWNGVFNENLPAGPESLTYGAVNQWSKEAVWFGWRDSDPMPHGGWTDAPTQHCFYELNLFGDPSLPILRPESP
jgi:hypothetical protein